jgi:hypothetical protein
MAQIGGSAPRRSSIAFDGVAVSDRALTSLLQRRSPKKNGLSRRVAKCRTGRCRNLSSRRIAANIANLSELATPRAKRERNRKK